MPRTVSRLGQQDNAGDAKALFLKRYAGETLAAFREKSAFMERHKVRTIDSGKSAQFPATWKASAEYHTPGTEITGGQIAHNERVISIDDMLISPLFIANIDEAMNHYDIRQEYSFQAGNVLAQTLDKNVAQVGVLAARDSATVTGASGGSVLQDTTFRSDADALVAGLFDASQALDEKDVPEEDRFAFLTPAEYNLLVSSSSRAIHRDYSGSGSIAKGTVMEIAGLEIIKTNNLPNALVSSGPADYQGDFTDTAGLVMHRSAVGTVKLIDLTVESDYEITYQGTMIVAKLAVGHGILRPEASVELSVTAPV